MPGLGQRLGITKGFKVLGESYGPPHESQPRSLLEGATAQALDNRRQLLTGVTLQTFRETGERELLIKAPQCVYDHAARAASSPGPLSVQTGDGKFLIEGEGFLWRQTNSGLIISNKVRTVIAPDLFRTRDPAATPRPSAPKPGAPLEIVADAFAYSRETGMSEYRGNVRVSETNQMSLVSQVLEIKLPVEPAPVQGRDAVTVPKGLESIRALQDVRVDYGEMQATGQVAVYTAQTGLVRMSGRPGWRVDQRLGGADELTLDRTNKIFRADGKAWFQTPAVGMSLSGLLNQTNDLPGSDKALTNHLVEVRSGAYEAHTNWAVFERDVHLRELVADQVRGTMDCDWLHGSFKGSNELETLSARTNVLIQNGTNWLRCGNAVLTGSNGVLTATEAPAWGAGTRSGKGDLVRINTRSNEMLVRGNASLELPARELAESGTFSLGPTNKAPVVRLATNGLAQIFCEEYVLRPEGANFQGGVYATHPRMNWACGSLAVELSRAAGRKQTLVAEQDVKFQLSGENGEVVEGVGDKAVYVYGVEAGATNDLLTLTGNPATLNMTNGTVRSKTILYDRAKNIVRTPGYSISFTNKAEGSNVLLLPKGKLTR